VITIHQRYRQTDRQTTCDRNTALCTKVHRAVKTATRQLISRIILASVVNASSRRRRGLGRPTASTADYPSVSVEICSLVAGVVSRPLAAGLRHFDNRHSPAFHHIVTAAVSDERRRSAYIFLVKIPAHHSAPSSAALAEGSRANYIQTCSPRVQVSTRVHTCIPY